MKLKSLALITLSGFLFLGCSQKTETKPFTTKKTIKPVFKDPGAYTWQQKYNPLEYKGTTQHINYKRPDYKVKDKYTSFKDDLAENNEAQRNREDKVKDTL